MDADLDTLATALYVRADDLLKSFPERAPWRPVVGFMPRIGDAEMVTLAVMQALLGHTSEARWLRFAREHLRHLFPYLPAAGLQQTTAPAGRHDELAHRCPGPRDQCVDRRRLGGRFHPGGVRPLP